MSELAPEGPGGGGGKKLFGLPRNVVIAFGLAAGGTILYLWWKNRGNAAAADGTNAAAGSGTQQFTTSGVDYSGELSVMQTELEDILQAIGPSTGAGSQGSGGGWDGGGSYSGSGGYGSGGSWDAGTGQGTDSGTSTGQNGSTSSGSTGSTSTGSSSTGSTSSGGTPQTSPASISASVSGSKVVLSGSTVGGATGYEWQVALPSGTLWHDSKTTVPSATYSPVPTTGVYHYKVRATNAAGAGPWSAVKTFTVTK